MMSRAPTSSTMDRVSRNTRSATGQAGPTRASAPSTKAVSVEIATPQPWISGVEGLIAT